MKDKQNSQREQLAPETYHQPRFFSYGNIRDITQATSVMTMTDDNSGVMGSEKT